MRVAVVGGGIAGLAAAWELRNDARIVVYERGRLGGRIRTSDFAGRPVDEGPDAFITRQPEAVVLCRELGLADELVAPGAGHTLIFRDGRLRPLPDGLVLGVPTGISTLVRSGLLSPAGLARAAVEPFLPRTRNPDGMSVRELISARFGTQVADRLVDPLVGSISAGWTGALAADEVVPQLVAAARRHRSLLLGLRTGSGGAAGGGPAFLTVPQGLGHLVDVLVSKLRGAGVEFISEAVTALAARGPAVTVTTHGTDQYDGAVVATSAATASELLWPGESTPLQSITTSSVALVTMSLPGTELPGGFNGFLVPRDAGLLMTACSFGSSKWRHWAEPGHALVRMSTGRSGDDRAMGLSDDELAGRLAEELGGCLGHPVTPADVRVSRWPDSFPQYTVGHRAAVDAAQVELLRTSPNVRLAGSSYHGIGIPACIASGRRAAAELRESREPARRPAPSEHP
jgi:oxygen-dependent protoporphyrinogen oxidase